MARSLKKGPFADGLKLADGFRSDKKENTSEKEYVESKQ